MYYWKEITGRRVILSDAETWSVLIRQLAVKGIRFFITETVSGLGD
jgi:hypothetical protein